MAFGGFDNKSSHAPMAEINMVPLIDVMLVLLVIFIVTAPLLSHSVKLELPKATAQVNQEATDKIEFAIGPDGALHWNGELVDRTTAQKRFAAAGQLKAQPSIHIRADQRVEYRYVAQALADASNAGLSKVGFISMPEQ